MAAVQSSAGTKVSQQQPVLNIMNTMTHKTVSTLALVLAASAFTAFAQDATAPALTPKHEKAARGEGKGMHNPLFLALDTNKDGTLDATEIANAPAALKTLDKNGDGQLTRDEFHRARPEGQETQAKEGKADKGAKAGGARKGRHALLNALDANGDNVIDATEIANAPAALKTLDKNGDGKITRDEIRPAGADGKDGAKKGGRKPDATGV